MVLDIVGKIVNTFNGEIIGLKITAGTDYTAVVTEEKARELGVRDTEIVKYLDLETVEAVPVGTSKYGVVNMSSAFFEEYEDSPKDYFGDRVLYYGYYFEDRYLVSLDNDLAIKRMIDSASGNYED